MWPFKKNKYEKLTREEVSDAIYNLETQLKKIEDEIVSNQAAETDLKKRGAKEPSRDMKIFYAKKINMLKAEREQAIKRSMYLMYNIQLLNKLKQAIDDNSFYKNTSKTPLSALLADQKGLANFLNSALQTKVSAEQVLTDADETFKEVAGLYEENQSIYGTNEADDALLSMFETEESLNDADVALDEEVAEAASAKEE